MTNWISDTEAIIPSYYSHMFNDEATAVPSVFSSRITNLMRTENILKNLTISHTVFLKTKKSPRPSDFVSTWSERRGSNPRPPGPEPGALPSCATSRCKPKIWREGDYIPSHRIIQTGKYRNTPCLNDILRIESIDSIRLSPSKPRVYRGLPRW